MSGVDNCLHFKSEEERQQWYSNAAKYWQVFFVSSYFSAHICFSIIMVFVSRCYTAFSRFSLWGRENAVTE